MVWIKLSLYKVAVKLKSWLELYKLYNWVVRVGIGGVGGGA
jgi:hypothetical protein